MRLGSTSGPVDAAELSVRYSHAGSEFAGLTKTSAWESAVGKIRMLRRVSLLAVACAAMLACSGCFLFRFTAEDAVELGVAKDREAAVKNLTRLNEYLYEPVDGPRDLPAFAQSYKSGAQLARMHKLKESSATEYQRFYDSLVQPDQDPELQGWKYFCLGDLKDPRTIQLLVDAVSAAAPSSPAQWESVTNAMYSIREMREVLDPQRKLKLKFLGSLSSLRVRASSESQSTVSQFLKYAAEFEARYKVPDVMTDMLLEVVNASTPDPVVIDVLRQCNDLFEFAAADKEAPDAEDAALLHAMAKAVGTLCLRTGEAGDTAWKIILEHAPVHGSDALIEHLSKAGGVPKPLKDLVATRAVDAVCVLPLMNAAGATARAQGHFIAHESGQLLDPRTRKNAGTVSDSTQRLRAFAGQVLERLEDDALWNRAVHAVSRHDRAVAATLLVALPNAAVSAPQRALDYVRSLSNLVSDATKAQYHSQVCARLATAATIPVAGVPRAALARVAGTVPNHLVASLKPLIEGKGAPQDCPKEMWEEWCAVYLQALKHCDKGECCEELTLTGTNKCVAFAHYSALSKVVLRLSPKHQLEVAEFLRARSPALAATTILAAVGSDTDKAGLVLTSALARIFAARQIEEGAVAESVVAHLARASSASLEDLALVGAGALVENAGPTARKAVAAALSDVGKYSRAVRVVFETSVDKWSKESE